MTNLTAYSVQELNTMTKKNFNRKKNDYVHTWYSEIMNQVKKGLYEVTLYIDDDDCHESDGTPWKYVEDAVEELEKLFPGIKIVDGRSTWPAYYEASWDDASMVVVVNDN